MKNSNKHIKSLAAVTGMVLGLFLGSAVSVAQTPVGTKIQNQALGMFDLKTGASDSIRTNTTETVVAAAPSLKPVLSLSLISSVSTVAPSGIVIYTIRVANTGNSSATSVVVTDTLPAQVNFAAALNGGQFNNGTVTWTLSALLTPGSADSVQVVVQVRDNLGQADTVIINTASVQCAEGVGVSDRQSVAIQSAKPASQPLLIAKLDADRSIARPGDNITFYVTVSNAGQAKAMNVVVVDSIPANSTFVSADNQGMASGGVAQWAIDSIGIGQLRTVKVVVRVNPSFLNGSIISRVCAYSGQISAQSNVATVEITTFVAVSLSLCTAKALVGNGKDTASVISVAKDGLGHPAPNGTKVLFSTTRGMFANGRDTVTAQTVNGVAKTILRSEIVFNELIKSTVLAKTVSSTGREISSVREVTFFPGALKGIVVFYETSQSVEGAVAVAYSESGIEAGRDTTGTDGRYLIPLPSAGTYTVIITNTNEFGDRVEIVSKLNAYDIPPQSGIMPSSAKGAITGNIYDRHTKQPIRKSGLTMEILNIGLSKESGQEVLLSALTTDDRGVFVFDSLNPGRYEVRVADSRYQGSAVVVVDTGMIVVGANIGVAEAAQFSITKSVNKRNVEIGDVVNYAIEIKNPNATVEFRNIQIVDKLPHGFGYSKESSRLDSLSIAEPAGSRTVVWTLQDTLRPGQSRKLTYWAIVGSDATSGDGINRAYAMATSSNNDTVTTLMAQAAVTVRPGIFTDRGIVIGKVFFDWNSNGYQDSDDRGIKGVEIWMEDGTKVITGDDGKYSLPEVLPGQHVLRVNKRSLPVGSLLVAVGTDFAGDEQTRFVRLSEGGIARADFYVLPPAQAELYLALQADTLHAVDAKVKAVFLVRQNEQNKAFKIVLTDTLGTGFGFDPTSITVNRRKVETNGTKSNILYLVFQGSLHGGIDTIMAEITADSTALNTRIETKATLVLSYAKRRDAAFKARMIPYFEESTGIDTTRLSSYKVAGSVNADTVQTHEASAKIEEKPVEVRKQETRPDTLGIQTPVVDGAATQTGLLIRYSSSKGYAVQVSAWRTRTKANEQARILKYQGHQTTVVKFTSKELGTRYRVLEGPYASREQAVAAMNELRAGHLLISQTYGVR